MLCQPIHKQRHFGRNLCAGFGEESGGYHHQDAERKSVVLTVTSSRTVDMSASHASPAFLSLTHSRVSNVSQKRTKDNE
jgi:hypothetical protein